MLTTPFTLAQSGMIDPSFTPGTGASSAILGIAVQEDGRIIIGGNFVTYNGIGMNSIARLNADGTLDGTFNPGIGTDGPIRRVVVQNDGRIIMAGQFTSYDGVSIGNVARTNSDGTLDAGFNTGTGANNTIRSMILQDDGRLVIGGLFTAFNGISTGRITRLDTNGGQDASFETGSGTDGQVSALAIQNDGKILIGGVFNNYNGVSRNTIARLNSDGTLDTSFNPGSGVNGEVLSIALQSDGKIIIMGNFTSYNGTPRNNIARLNTNGSLDGTFNSGTGANDHVLAGMVQNDDRIIIGGEFTSYNGTTRQRIARLNSDGTLDTYFDPGSGANSGLVAIAGQSDGKVMIGGWFTTYSGYERNHIARIMVIPTSVEDLHIEELPTIHPNPFSSYTTIAVKEDIRNGLLEIYNSAGATVARMENLSGRSIILQRNDLASGQYFVRLTSEGKSYETTPLIVVD